MDAVVARLVVSKTQMWHKISLPDNGGKEIQKVQDYQTFPRCNGQINLMLSFSDDFLHKSSLVHTFNDEEHPDVAYRCAQSCTCD